MQVEIFFENENSHAHINLCLVTTASINFSIEKTIHSVEDEVFLPEGIQASSESLRGAAISGLFFRLGQLRQGGELPCLTISIGHIKGRLDGTDLTIIAEIASLALAYAMDIGDVDFAVSVNEWRLVDVRKSVKT